MIISNTTCIIILIIIIIFLSLLFYKLYKAYRVVNGYSPITSTPPMNKEQMQTIKHLGPFNSTFDFPIPGLLNKDYKTENSNNIYRWDGEHYQLYSSDLSVPENFGKLELKTPNNNAPVAINVTENEQEILSIKSNAQSQLDTIRDTPEEAEVQRLKSKSIIDETHTRINRDIAAENKLKIDGLSPEDVILIDNYYKSMTKN